MLDSLSLPPPPPLPLKYIYISQGAKNGGKHYCYLTLGSEVRERNRGEADRATGPQSLQVKYSLARSDMTEVPRPLSASVQMLLAISNWIFN